MSENPMRLWRAYAMAALGGGASVKMARDRADAMLPIDAEVQSAIAAAHERATGEELSRSPDAKHPDDERWNPGHPEDENLNCLLALRINGEWELLNGCAWTSLGDEKTEPSWVPEGLTQLAGEDKEAREQGDTYKIWALMHDRIEQAEHVLWRPAPALPPDPS